MKGRDGRTAFERLYGKPLREEGLELGEKVLWKRPEQAGSNTLLECRREEGVWLGRRWGSITHLIGVGREAVETRAVQRRPREDRWCKEMIEGLRATPWLNPAPDGEADAPVALPPRGEPAPRPALDGPSAREGPKHVYIRDTDLEKFGCTSGCRRCGLMRENRPARGIRHTPACRARIEEAMRGAGDDRLRRADLRRDDELARRLEAADRGGEEAVWLDTGEAGGGAGPGDQGQGPRRLQPAGAQQFPAPVD